MPSPRPAALLILALILIAQPVAQASDSAVIECPWIKTEILESIDTGGQRYPSSEIAMEIRSDGRPLIVYSAGPINDQALRMINCHDARCSNFEGVELDRTLNYRDAIGLAVSVDGRPLILYGTGALNYHECANERCTLSRSRWIEPTPSAGSLRDMFVRPDGRPQLVYANGGGGDAPWDIFSYVCDDTRCATGVRRKLVDVPPDAYNTMGASTALDRDGRLALSFLQNDGDYEETAVRFAKCVDANCDSVETTTLSSEVGYRAALYTWMRLQADGRPLVLDHRLTWLDDPPVDVFSSLLIECADSLCEDVLPRALSPQPDRQLVGFGSHGAGLPVMGALSDTSAGFYICDDVECSDARLIETAASDPVLNSASLQIAPGLRPMLAYFDTMGRELRLAQCAPIEVFSDDFG